MDGMNARIKLIQSIAAPIDEARDLVDLHHAEVLHETPLFLAEYDSAESEVHLTLDDARACCDDITAAVANGRCWDWTRNEDGVYVQFWTHEDDDRPLYLTGGTVTEVTVHRPEAAQEKDTAPAATSTPRPAAEIKLVGYAAIALTGWELTELAPDYYGHTFMQLDGWLPADLGRDQAPGGTAQMEYAHLHDQTVPLDLNVQVEVKGYGEPCRFIKIRWRKDGGSRG